SLRLGLDMPAGLPNRVLASSAEDARPAKAVPMPLALCSLIANPLARAALEALAASSARAALGKGWGMGKLLGDKRGARNLSAIADPLQAAKFMKGCCAAVRTGEGQ